MPNLSAALERIRSTAPSTTVKGRRFERMFRAALWEYLYGVLHAPDWRNKYASELRKDLARIPLATDFRAFQKAGQQLIGLHVSYETCKPWPLDIVTTSNPDDPDLYRIDQRMRWNKERNADGKLVLDKSVLHINDRCRIKGIPYEAHHYEVNRKTPLGWAIDRLKIATDKKSGIKNDANQWDAWVDDPYQLILHLQRLVWVSVETAISSTDCHRHLSK